MEILLGVLLILTVVATFFTIPYSKAKVDFNRLSKRLMLTANQSEATFEQADLTGLPLPVQKYFTYCEYLGKSKMQIMKAVYKDVNFKFGKNKPTLKIDYVQYNFVNEPARIAYIDSTFYGIPFEGLDSFIAGKGSMTGIIAKLFTLFSQTGEAMDEASLVTFLSESLLIPNAALQEYITWCEIDNLHAEATISYYGKTVSGICFQRKWRTDFFHNQ